MSESQKKTKKTSETTTSTSSTITVTTPTTSTSSAQASNYASTNSTPGSLNSTVQPVDATVLEQALRTILQTQQPTVNSTENAQVSSINARLPMPIFDKKDIETWFTRLESWFFTSGVKSDLQKYHTVISASDSSTINQIQHVVNNPPAGNEKYNAIKTALIQAFAASDSEHVNKILLGMQLGDKKPSQLLNDMRHTAGNLGDRMISQLWARQLPAIIQPIVAVNAGNLQK